MGRKPTVVFDFDGVIHSYISGWRGETTIPDDPVAGIRDVIAELRERYRIYVVSARCRTDAGQRAVERWLEKHAIAVDGVARHKPPALVYIDDRALTFDGNPSHLPEQIAQFQTWMQRENASF